MRYQLNVTLTEEDYLAFNNFHALESTFGKRQIRNSRILLITCMTVLMAFVLLVLGWTTFSVIYVILLGLFLVLYLLLFKKIIKRNIKAQIKRLKKTGKLPFDSAASLEFYDDKIVEITADKRVEQRYDGLERICVAGDEFIYLYNSSVNAYILPISQLRKQLEQEDFLNFLSQKCNSIEYYYM